jgi:hypothetical protein
VSFALAALAGFGVADRLRLAAAVRGLDAFDAATIGAAYWRIGCRAHAQRVAIGALLTARRQAAVVGDVAKWGVAGAVIGDQAIHADTIEAIIGFVLANLVGAVRVLSAALGNGIGL